MRRARKSKDEVLAARREIQRLAAEGRLVFPDAIYRIRDALDMTQAEFAQAFGLTRQQVVALEAGKANPTVETLKRIMRPFRLTLGIVPAPDDPEAESSVRIGQ